MEVRHSATIYSEFNWRLRSWLQIWSIDLCWKTLDENKDTVPLFWEGEWKINLILGISLQAFNVEKPFACPICPYSTFRRNHLDIHLRTHTGEKPYRCNLCSYAASTNQNLKRHKRVHTGEKPFPCPHCPYRATQSSDLKNHIRIHTGDKPFPCPYPNCTYAASQNARLRRHIRNHMEEASVSIHWCSLTKGRQFLYSTLLCVVWEYVAISGKHSISCVLQKYKNAY